MPVFTLPLVPSRHTRSAKADYMDALKNCAEVRQVRAIRYRADIVFYAPWTQKNGDPKKRDTDSPIIPLLDAIAAAAGIDDKWIRKGSWDTVESDRETTVVRLTPI